MADWIKAYNWAPVHGGNVIVLIGGKDLHPVDYFPGVGKYDKEKNKWVILLPDVDSDHYVSEWQEFPENPE